MYAQVSNNFTNTINNLQDLFNSQPVHKNSAQSTWDCFNNLEDTIQGLSGINFQLDQQTEILMKISNELKSIETDLSVIQTKPASSLPQRRRKILKPRKTQSRTIMHKILDTDSFTDDDLEAEIIMPKFANYTAILNTRRFAATNPKDLFKP